MSHQPGYPSRYILSYYRSARHSLMGDCLCALWRWRVCAHLPDCGLGDAIAHQLELAVGRDEADGAVGLELVQTHALVEANVLKIDGALASLLELGIGRGLLHLSRGKRECVCVRVRARMRKGAANKTENRERRSRRRHKWCLRDERVGGGGGGGPACARRRACR